MQNENFYSYGNPTCYNLGGKKGWRCELPYTDENGMRKRKTFSAKTKKEALARKDAFLSYEKQRKRDADKKQHKATVPDYLTESANRAYELGTIRISTFERRKNTINIFLKHEIGVMPITDIKEEDVVKFLTEIRNAGYSNSVLKKVFAALSSAFEIARDKGVITKNIMKSQNVVRPKSLKETKKIRALSVEQQQKLEEVLRLPRFQKENIPYGDMLLIELRTGMRMGEIAALKPEDIDFEKKKISISKTISRDGSGRPCIHTPKTQAGYRTIPFGDAAEPVLRRVVDAYQENPEGLLFYDFRNNHPVYSQMVNLFFFRICKKYGIEHEGGQHLLRHTFATRAFEAGIDPVVVQKWLGHTDIRITLNTYTDVFDAMHEDNVKKMDKYSKEVIIPHF